GGGRGGGEGGGVGGGGGRRMGLFGSHRRVLNRRSVLPFDNGFGIDTVLSRQTSYARLTILDCTTDCLCRSGASVKYLSHNCSFCIAVTVPLYSGTIQLELISKKSAQANMK